MPFQNTEETDYWLLSSLSNFKKWNRNLNEVRCKKVMYKKKYVLYKPPNTSYKEWLQIEWYLSWQPF